MKKRRQWIVALALVSVAMMAIGCGEVSSQDESTETGVQAITQIGSSEYNDVESMHYTVTRVECSSKVGYDGDYGVVYDDQVSLKDLTLPGGIPSFIDQPFDENSAHQFADKFLLLDAGCYDVHVQPMRSEYEVSESCVPVEKQGIKVEDGETTEVLLVSQCAGKEKGALDVITALNHPPHLSLLDLDPQKFVTCPAEGNPMVTVCAEATDPDGDPMEFKWEALEGGDHVVSSELTSSYDEAGEAGQCYEVELERKDASYLARVTVYDLFIEFINGERSPVRAEDWLAMMGFTGPDGEALESRASLEFPVYVGGCDEEFICPRSQGYWKTPPNNLDRIKEKWEPTGFDPETQSLCPEQGPDLWLNDVLQNPPEGNMYYILAIQYVAAKLNVAGGATVMGDVEDDIAAAEALLEGGSNCETKGSDWSQVTRDEAEAIKDRLEAFNVMCANGENDNTVR